MLEIGTKVRIRERLRTDKIYGKTMFVEGMRQYRNKIAKITHILSVTRYKIDLDDEKYEWDEEMFSAIIKPHSEFAVGDKVIGNTLAKKYGITHEGFIGTIFEISKDSIKVGRDESEGYWVDKNAFDLYEEKPTSEKTTKESDKSEETNSEQIDKLTKAIDKLSKEIRKEDPFKEAMLKGIIEKGKELATEDLRKEIKEDLDKFIQDTYGNLPKKLIIERNTTHKELEGIFHKDFEKICKIVDSNIPLMLVGGAGAGKNYTLEQVAQALDLTFYTTNAVNQDYKLTGFIDANGKYHETEFYKAFVNGGMFFLDEIDASCPEALVTLNSAIANKYFDFPVGRVTAHKDFRVVCAGNTYGTGADMVYVGRNVLDGATLDRFVVLEFDYDEEVEKQLAYDDDLFRFIKDLRNAVNKAGLRYIVSMRALINSTKLLSIGVDKQTILKTTVVKNMQRDDLNTVIDKLEITSSDWYRELKRLCD